MKRLFVIVILLFFHGGVFAQFTPKDVKIYLDNIANSDSTSSVDLTKEELVHAKGITANFAWVNIRSLKFYISNACILSGLDSYRNSGGVFNPETKKMLEQTIHSGSTVTIEANCYTKQNVLLGYPYITIHIR